MSNQKSFQTEQRLQRIAALIKNGDDLLASDTMKFLDNVAREICSLKALYYTESIKNSDLELKCIKMKAEINLLKGIMSNETDDEINNHAGCFHDSGKITDKE